MLLSHRLASFCGLAVMALAGCEPAVAAEAQYPVVPDGQPAPGQLPPQGAYIPGQLPQQLPPQGGYAPGQRSPQGGYAPAQPPPPAPVVDDPINTMDIAWLRATAGAVLGELIAALPPAAQARVAGVPFVTDSTVGEVNAYAACNEQHQPLMAMTDGLLQIEGYTAQLRAVDELFGTQKLDGYLTMVAKYQKPHQAIVSPPIGYVDAVQMSDPRKVARQHQLLEEQIAFVLGHELAHHHLGHTGCAKGPSGERAPSLLGTAIDMALGTGRLLTQVVPVTNQPNEAFADLAGVNDLLTAGARRPGYHWTEEGALLTLDFFSRLDQLSHENPLTPDGLLYTFESSHPRPSDRVGGVQRAAAEWRARGGVPVYPMALP